MSPVSLVRQTFFYFIWLLMLKNQTQCNGRNCSWFVSLQLSLRSESLDITITNCVFQVAFVTAPVALLGHIAMEVSSCEWLFNELKFCSLFSRLLDFISASSSDDEPRHDKHSKKQQTDTYSTYNGSFLAELTIIESNSHQLVHLIHHQQFLWVKFY